MSKRVVIYNDRRGVEQTFPSMAEAARTLDVDVSQVEKARKTGNWVFRQGIGSEGSYLIEKQPLLGERSLVCR